jgi:hypothetical protein
MDPLKDRLVAQGFSRRPGVDCSHTFSHVVKLSTLRIVLPLAAPHDMHAHSAHIETAFLNVDLQKDFVMRQPNVRSRWHSQGHESPKKDPRTLASLSRAVLTLPPYSRLPRPHSIHLRHEFVTYEPPCSWHMCYLVVCQLHPY